MHKKSLDKEELKAFDLKVELRLDRIKKMVDRYLVQVESAVENKKDVPIPDQSN